MHSYFAIHGRRIHADGWYGCLTWAIEQLRNGHAPIKIVRARAGAQFGKIIAEVTSEGFRAILGGRQVDVKALLRGQA